MPSNAYKKFTKVNMDDVNKIIDTYHEMKGPGVGKRDLDYLTRSGILLLAAAWEVYIEEVLEESLGYLLDNCLTPHELPNLVQEHVGKTIIDAKNFKSIIAFSGIGWRTVIFELFKHQIDELNTPSPKKIAPFAKNYLAATGLVRSWRRSNDIVDFIRFRGGIAHNLKSEKYVYLHELEHYIKVVKQTVYDTDTHLYHHLPRAFNHPRHIRVPWNRI